MMTEPVPAPDASYARLQFDEPDEPTNFRRCPWMPMSGSAQFGRVALRSIISQIRETTAAPILDVDLRQEAHGFVRVAPEDEAVIPISWFAKNDWGFVGMTDLEARDGERERLAVIRRSPLIYVYDKGSDDAQHIPIDGAIDEEVLVLGEDVGYERLRVTDHLRPRNHIVDAFVDIVAHHLDIKPWYHFHCHAGDGRTTTFMVLYDMLMNAATTDCCEILERNCLLSNYDLTAALPEPYTRYSIERRDFVMTFYEYARQGPIYTGMRWSEWAP